MQRVNYTTYNTQVSQNQEKPFENLPTPREPPDHNNIVSPKEPSGVNHTHPHTHVAIKRSLTDWRPTSWTQSGTEKSLAPRANSLSDHLFPTIGPGTWRPQKWEFKTRAIVGQRVGPIARVFYHPLQRQARFEGPNCRKKLR